MFSFPFVLILSVLYMSLLEAIGLSPRDITQQKLSVEYLGSAAFIAIKPFLLRLFL